MSRIGPSSGTPSSVAFGDDDEDTRYSDPNSLERKLFKSITMRIKITKFHT